MGWLQKLFGQKKPDNAQVNPQPQVADAALAASAGLTENAPIPPERVGLSGEYDQSGLAKRVCLAFDENPALAPYSEDTVWVAQTGTTVVLKGKVPSQDILNQMVSVALTVNGAASVNTDQVSIG
jgi:hypothetical protein